MAEITCNTWFYFSILKSIRVKYFYAWQPIRVFFPNRQTRHRTPIQPVLGKKSDRLSKIKIFYYNIKSKYIDGYLLNFLNQIFVFIEIYVFNLLLKGKVFMQLRYFPVRILDSPFLKERFIGVLCVLLRSAKSLFETWLCFRRHMQIFLASTQFTITESKYHFK